MRVNNVFSGRPQFYDRGPLQKAFAYRATGVAPHVLTTRYTYTVPSGRKFWGTSIYLFSTRETVAGTPGDVQVDDNLLPSGGSATLVVSTSFLGNTVDTSRTASIGGVAMYAGDAITGETIDTSTTGSVTYGLGMQGTEFDA